MCYVKISNIMCCTMLCFLSLYYGILCSKIYSGDFDKMIYNADTNHVHETYQ